jgi:cytochrome P450
VSGTEQALKFVTNPIEELDRRLRGGERFFWLGADELVVGDAAHCRAILSNLDGAFAEHSDFFRCHGGFLQPRERQQRIARDGAALLRAHVIRLRKHTNFGFATVIEQELAGKRLYPDAANLLMLRLLGSVLVTPGSAPAVERLVERIVRRTILRGTRNRARPASGLWFRWRTIYLLVSELEKRAAYRVEQPRDILDLIAGHGEGDARLEDLAQTFLSFLVAIVGSLGFLLAWALYLQGRHDRMDAQPLATVREALRLWPIAWLFARFPHVSTEIGGYIVKPGQQVTLCPYLAHRDHTCYENPDEFNPDRWTQPGVGKHYLPFGWGEHRCTAASLSVRIVSDLLGIINQTYRLNEWH